MQESKIRKILDYPIFKIANPKGKSGIRAENLISGKDSKIKALLFKLSQDTGHTFKQLDEEMDWADVLELHALRNAAIHEENARINQQ